MLDLYSCTLQSHHLLALSDFRLSKKHTEILKKSLELDSVLRLHAISKLVHLTVMEFDVDRYPFHPLAGN